jgi:hypothetical protein
MSGVGLQTRPRARAKYAGIVLDGLKWGEAAGGVLVGNDPSSGDSRPHVIREKTRGGFVKPST